MLASAYSLASNIRLASNFRLSWIRKYARKDVNLSGQKMARRLQDESFVSFTGRPNEDSKTYEQVMRQVLDLGVGKAVETGLHVSDLERTTKLIFDSVKEHLCSRKRMVRKFEEISQIGTIAANGDRKVGELIAKAFAKLGTEGVIRVSDEQTSNMELEIFNVMYLQWYPISPIFLTDLNKREFIGQLKILKNPLVLIFESKICNKNVVAQAITMARDRHLLIVAEDVEETVMGYLFLDKHCLQSKVCIVRPRKDRENWKELMQDLAVFTGSRVVTGSHDCNNILQMVGSCKKVGVTEASVHIYAGGSASQETIENRREQLRSLFKLSTPNDEKRIYNRLILLSCSVGILKIGGGRNFRKKKSLILNAINTAKRAVEEGILPGAGVALLHASKVLDNLQTTNSDERIIIKLFQDAFKMSVWTNASLLGFDGSFVVQKLLDQDNPDLGYDPIKGEYVDVMQEGIFDVTLDLLRPFNLLRGDFVDMCVSRGLDTSTRNSSNNEQERT